MLKIDITTITRVLPEHTANTNRILDEMDAERERNLTNWSTCRNSRSDLPQYNGFRSDWYEWEEDESYCFVDNMDRM